MADPFQSLREPTVPVAPDPLFAAHLRARIVRALALPKGVTVSDVVLDPEPAPDPAPRQAIIPYLIVADARRALGWYADVMGAARQGEALVMPDGRIGHSELRIAGGTVYLADESPVSDVAAPRSGQGAAVSLTLSVPDVDQLADRAVRAGAVLERPPADYSYGRDAVIRDPFGHRWIVSAAVARRPPVSPPPVPVTSGVPRTAGDRMRTGDIAYVSLWVPDLARATEFYGDVLDWTYRPGGAEPGRQVAGLSLPHGLFGGQSRSNLFLCFAVDDVGAAVAQVVAAGGEAEEPQDEPYGRVADCVDDQGVRFALVEIPAESALRPRGPVNGERNGDLSYVTMEVVDSAQARAFYGAVLGWRFRPGRAEDGWGPVDVVPMVGLSGGHAQATTVPMYRVDDIGAVVDRLRAHGGTATDPVEQPYGLTSECVDDQGTRFYLGQL
jgi:predicted enzyme related to lactoylglutathione lyase